MRLPTWSWLALTGLTLATSNSTSYTDPATNIAFQRWCDEAKGLCFGVSLPETVATDFIGQLTVLLTDGKGWGGVSLSGSMTSSLLIAAWPNGDSGMGSLRKTTSYTNPGEYTDASMLEIPDGVAVNNTHLTYTFLCKGCVVGAPTTFEKDAETYVFGWGLSKTSPTSPGSSAAVLPYHAAGFGTFEMLLGQAKSAEYGTWAGKAKAKAKTKPSASAVSVSASASATPSPSTPPKVSNATYDYIVVGSGAAGLVAAERLAETKQKVLLLERGGPSTASMGANNTLAWNTNLTPHDVPALGSSLSELGLLDDYLCPDTAGMAGCVLGGSTIINALAFVHPQSADFDKWPAGWKWADVAAAAKRLYERNPGSMLPSADGKRYDQSLYGVLSSFLNRLGWKSIDQQAQPDEKHMAYSYPSWSVAEGIRAGPVRSYLPLAQGHNNFTLRLRTKVRRVVRRGGRVTGVEVETASNGLEIIHVRAGGKVILAGGALSTPRILFNSGIGPAKQLKSVQGGSTGTTLPPAGEWIDLPVGQNLRDHPMFTVTVDSKTNVTAFNTSSVIPGPGGSAQRLYDNGSGVLTEGGHRLQFWTSNEGSDGITRFYQGSCSADADGAITMKLYLMHGATSSGVLGIDSQGSTTIETEPWLQTQADREAASVFLRDLVHDLHHSPLGFSVRDFSSVAAVLDQKTSGDHYVGTAMMGAVVDADARVYRTENLFIVDASIHPDLPTGNTQAIVMIVAEAAVERIRSVGRARVSMSPSASASASAVDRKPVRTPAM